MDSEVIVALIGGAVTVANVIFTALVNNRQKKQVRNDMAEMCENTRTKQLESGVQCLLRAEIIRSHEKYMDKQYCPVYAREALTRAYDAYHGLGGNGTMTTLYNQIMLLPTENEVHNED